MRMNTFSVLLLSTMIPDQSYSLSDSPEPGQERRKEMAAFTTILWDLDQTILDFKKSMDYALRGSFRQLHLSIDEEKIRLYSDINDSYWLRFERGEITKDEVLLGRFRTFYERLGIVDKAPEEIAELYQNALGEVYFFRDKADELTLQLKEKGYRQYIITNGVHATQAKKVRLSGLERIMDGVFVSELIGYPKPQKEYFDACFAMLPGVARKECILVGDSITSDMQGGVNAGGATCWYNPDRRPAPSDLPIDYEIGDLWELLPILQERIPCQNQQIKN